MKSWEVSGRYVEACNCEAVCPCRLLGDGGGGRATYQLCQFALAWTVDKGRFGDLELAGLSVVMAGYWDEDEDGKPWRVELYVDERGGQSERTALSDIFLGRAGGTPAKNYAPAIREVLAVNPAAIEVVHARGTQKIRVGDAVQVVARAVYPAAAVVSCGIPGHDHPGDELVHETLRVSDPRLDFEFSGRCGFATSFDYRS